MANPAKVEFSPEEIVYINLHEAMTKMYEENDPHCFRLAAKLLKKPELPSFFTARCHVILSTQLTPFAALHAEEAIELLEGELHKFLIPDPVLVHNVQLAKKYLEKANTMVATVLAKEGGTWTNSECLAHNRVSRSDLLRKVLVEVNETHDKESTKKNCEAKTKKKPKEQAEKTSEHRSEKKSKNKATKKAEKKAAKKG